MEIDPVVDWLNRKAVSQPDSIFILTNNNSFTFGETSNIVYTLSNTLENTYNISGCNVIVKANHSSNFIFVLLALLRLGKQVLPVDPNATDNELRSFSNRLSATIISPDVIEISSGIVSIIDSNFGKSGILLATSGSTGKPKLVQHTPSTLLAAVTNYNYVTNNNDGKLLASLPFYHTGGFMVIIRALVRGNSLIIPDTVKPADLLTTMNIYNPDAVSLVEPQLLDLLPVSEQIRHKPEFVFCGGSKFQNNILSEAIQKGWNIINVYGSTETASMVCFNNNVLSKPEIAGKPVPNVNIYIEDGEIVISSPSLATGYFDDNELSELNFRDGKYYTGDIGNIDDDGNLYITGRKSRMIISGGKNIDPVEIETELKKISGIDDIFICGSPDTHWGEKVTAIIATEDFDIIDSEKLKCQLKKVLPGYKIPKAFVFVDYIPRNSLGKIDKREVNLLLRNI